MTTKMIVLQAAPSVRLICPDSYLEGEWREVPEEAEVIKMFAVEYDEEALRVDGFEEEATLEARDCGRMMRRDDGVTARVWEVRRPEDWIS
jgi:hypothetical protein